MRSGKQLSLLFLAAILAACGGGGGSAAGGTSGGGSAAQTVNVRALDTLRFDPATITVRSGAPVHLTLDNTGSLVHDWVVDDLDGGKISLDAEGGKSASTDFTPSRAATYQFYCSQPGHKEAGMIGTLTVQ